VSGYGYTPSSFNTSYPSFTAPGVSGNTLGSNGTFTLSNPNTVFFVGKNEKSNNHSFVYNTPQNSHTLFINGGPGRYSMYAGGGAQVDNLSIAGTDQSSMMVTAVFNGAASAFIQNGSTITSNFDPGSGGIVGGLVLGQWYVQDDKAWGGKFCEFMMYSNVLAPFDRQKVEGYLAWKWGLQSNLPTTHPFKSAAPLSNSVFSPTSFSNLQVWYDGADPLGTGTAPSNGTSITTWVDKSSSGNSATAGATAAVYDATSRSVYFGGSTSNYNTSYSASLSNETVFMVGMITTNTSTTPGLAASDTGGRSFTFNPLANSSRNVAWGSKTTSDTRNMITLGSYTNASNTGTVYLDGGRETAASVILSYTSGRTTQLTGNYANFYEIIAYNRPLSTDDRQTVEGYLAWKWGLQGNLPAAHPYKFLSPASNYAGAVVPQGLLVRFDATTYSGSGAWANTAALGTTKNATIATGSASKNGAGNGIVFNGTNTWQFSNPGNLSTLTVTAWVKRTATPVASGETAIISELFGDPGNGQYYINAALTFGVGSVSTATGFDSLYGNSGWIRGPDRVGTTLNQWIQITATHDGNVLRTYSNATLVGFATQGPIKSSGLSWVIGGGWFGTNPINAEIGQILIYNRAISATEVAQNYAATSNTFSV
jgi:hypothetical protein